MNRPHPDAIGAQGQLRPDETPDIPPRFKFRAGEIYGHA